MFGTYLVIMKELLPQVVAVAAGGGSAKMGPSLKLSGGGSC